MRKLLLFFITLQSFAAIAQTLSNGVLNVNLTIQDATCLDNGVARFQLVDGTGNPTTATALGLTDNRCYYIKQGSTTKHYSDYGIDTLLLEAGTYTFGYEAMFWNGNNYELLDVQTVQMLNTSYRIPTVSALYTVAHTEEGYGRWPTIGCENTGRIQLKIEGGKFPYTVVRKDHSSSIPVDTVVFNTYQYIDPSTFVFLNDSDVTRYDYKDYYTFDSLPAGDWDFYVSDGCGYNLPRIGQIVETLVNPVIDTLEILEVNSNDSNIVRLGVVFDKTTLLYQYDPVYRFVNADLGSTDWLPIPYTDTGRVEMNDTAFSAANYCDLFNKNLSIEYKLNRCNVSPRTKSFYITTPTRFYTDYSDYIDSRIEEEGNTCLDIREFHSYFYSIRMQSYNYNDYNQLYFTTPLTWVYTDNNTNMVIKRDTIRYPHNTSYLWDRDIEAVYGSFRNEPRHLNLKRQLVDAKGCVLYSQDGSFTYKYDLGVENVDWRLERSVDEDHCCTYNRWINVYEHYKSHASQDGNIIRLVRSPYNNKYNFEAVYNEASESWMVTKSNLENMASIVGASNGRALTIYDYCLPSGPYHFEVLTGCDTFYLQANYSFPDRYSLELTEDISFSSVQHCTDMYLKPLSGEISWVRRNTSVSTGLELDPVYTPVSTSFKIISGPTGGFGENYFNIGDSVRISMPGTFVVEFSRNNELDDYCDDFKIYDTIVYDGAVLDYEYKLTLLCDSFSTTGDAYVKALAGTPPYTYTLYSGPDMTGSVIASNNTGVFENVPFTIHDEPSCFIEDACAASFYINMTPSSLQAAQKSWFTGGLKTQTACEGSVITVHAFSLVPIFSYEWTGPGGFHSISSDPQIFIPRNSPSGWYKVILTSDRCGEEMMDSVYLDVNSSPSLDIEHDMEVCPGSDVSVTLTPRTPNGSATVSFTAAVENVDGVSYYTFNDVPVDVPQTLTVNVSSLTKIYSASIDDGICDYALADDTVYLTLRTDVANGCTMLTTDTLVCYGTDARLFSKSTMSAPYTLRWYADYGLTTLLKEDHINTDSDWSYYDTTGLTAFTTLYTAIEKEGFCPTVHGLPTHRVNMANDTVTLYCGDVYRLYDSGGENGNYGTGESLKYYFATEDGGRVSIRFENLDLESGSVLHVISGDELSADSVIYSIYKGTTLPEIILSRGNKMTLWFISGNFPPASGWSALVEREPGVSVADVWSRNHVTLHDEVCQNQSGDYADPYGAKLWNAATSAAITNDVKKAGIYSYTYTQTNSDIHGCDTTTTLILTVGAPPHSDTSVTITNLMGSYYWDKTGETYTTSGLYSKLYSQADGCDSLALLYLTILEVDTSINEICVGDSTMLGIMATVPEITWNNNLVPDKIVPGDLLLDDGTIIKVDNYDNTIHAAPKGIVFYVDSTDMHGWAVALTDAYSSACIWAAQSVRQSVHSQTMTSIKADALTDFAGKENTLRIKTTAEAVGSGSFAFNAPAAYYCYYYDHLIGTTGTEAKGWYLPSIGQINLLYMNRAYIHSSIATLAGIASPIPNPLHSSTEANINSSWFINNIGTINSYSKYDSVIFNRYARAVCDF
jgi:hypothetical protein